MEWASMEQFLSFCENKKQDALKEENMCMAARMDKIEPIIEEMGGWINFYNFIRW